MKSKNKLVKILVPIFIVVALSVIWVIKNVDFTKNTTQVVTEDFELESKVTDIETLKKYNLPMILDFGAEWCIPCKQMDPILKSINSQMQGKAIIKFIDIEKNEDFAIQYPVRVVPTQVIIDSKGNPYVPSENVRLNFIMYKSKKTGEHAITVHEGILNENQIKVILKDMGVVV